MAARTAKKPEEPLSDQTPPEPDLTYEQARDELISVVSRLESGGESLTESMELFKRGEYLAQVCERYLTDARETLESGKEN